MGRLFPSLGIFHIVIHTWGFDYCFLGWILFWKSKTKVNPLSVLTVLDFSKQVFSMKFFGQLLGLLVLGISGDESNNAEKG